MATNKPKKLIYADDIFAALLKKGWGCTDAANFVKSLRTADAAPVVHGRWVKDEERSKNHIEYIYVCSACESCEAWGAAEKTNYCPYCGAVMDLEG